MELIGTFKLQKAFGGAKTSHNTALPLRAAESQFMMSEKQVESWSRRGHIDSLTEPAGRVDQGRRPACKLIDVGNPNR